MYDLMTAGPTRVCDAVMQARSRPFPNPDQDPAFVEDYHTLCRQISALLGDESYETLILSGEGILGLEAAVATLTEPGDRVLILDNGVFGAGFADFVRLYGGEAVLYRCDPDHPIDPAALRQYLTNDHAFRYATIVHCDTPSAMKNDIAVLCPLLKQYGIITLVDAVASMFGEPLDVHTGIDIVCGASQKVLSAPPGLAFVSIHPALWAQMQQRKTPVASFYANLLLFAQYYEEKWFPYTMPASDLQGLAVALARLAADKDCLARHARLSAACRAALRAGGLRLYPQSGYVSTVTAFCVPEGLTDKEILSELMQRHAIMLSSSFGPFGGKLLRIGHMGENCHREPLQQTLAALDDSLRRLGFTPRCDLAAAFDEALT